MHAVSLPSTFQNLLLNLWYTSRQMAPEGQQDGNSWRLDWTGSLAEIPSQANKRTA